MTTNAAIGPDPPLLASNSKKEFQAQSPSDNSTLSLGGNPQENSPMPPTFRALGSDLASRAMPIDLSGNMVPSDTVANAAASKPMAAETAPTIESAAATIVNAVVEQLPEPSLLWVTGQVV